jgi:hypothetical protein
MTIKNIVFFNYAHKGDVFLSRAFVCEIMETLKNFDINFSYTHYWGEYLLRDLDCKFIKLEEVPEIHLKSKKELGENFVKDDTVYINTWIGKYFDKSKQFYAECNLRSIYSLMYAEIYNFLSEIFSIDFKLKNIIQYFPTIDYSCFNIASIDEFLKNNKGRKVLLCNGPALSGQCNEYNGDLTSIIEKLLGKYINTIFITTHKINLQSDRLFYTGDIIQSDLLFYGEGQVSTYIQDINEISYLSRYCDLIIGRSSGPFTFTNVYENMINENKKFLCFGKRETDCAPYQLDISCHYVYEKFDTLENLEETIVELMNNENTI